MQHQQADSLKLIFLWGWTKKAGWTQTVITSLPLCSYPGNICLWWNLKLAVALIFLSHCLMWWSFYSAQIALYFISSVQSFRIQRERHVHSDNVVLKSHFLCLIAGHAFWKQFLKRLQLRVKSRFNLNCVWSWPNSSLDPYYQISLSWSLNIICLRQCHLGCPWVSRPSAPICTFPPRPSATTPQAYTTPSPPVTTATSKLPMAWWQVSGCNGICAEYCGDGAYHAHTPQFFYNNCNNLWIVLISFGTVS